MRGLSSNSIYEVYADELHFLCVRLNQFDSFENTYIYTLIKRNTFTDEVAHFLLSQLQFHFQIYPVDTYIRALHHFTFSRLRTNGIDKCGTINNNVEHKAEYVFFLSVYCARCTMHEVWFYHKNTQERIKSETCFSCVIFHDVVHTNMRAFIKRYCNKNDHNLFYRCFWCGVVSNKKICQTN